MKKLKFFLILLIVMVLIIISVPYLIVRDLDSIIGKDSSNESYDYLTVEKDGLYYAEKKVMIEDKNEIKKVIEYFKSFKYHLSSKKEFRVKDEPYTFIFTNEENGSHVEIFVYNKQDVMIRSDSKPLSYYIKGNRNFDFAFFKEILSKGVEIEK